MVSTLPGHRMRSTDIELDRANNSMAVAAKAVATNNVSFSDTVNWSPDSQYIAIEGGDIIDGYENGGIISNIRI